MYIVLISRCCDSSQSITLAFQLYLIVILIERIIILIIVARALLFATTGRDTHEHLAHELDTIFQKHHRIGIQVYFHIIAQ